MIKDEDKPRFVSFNVLTEEGKRQFANHQIFAFQHGGPRKRAELLASLLKDLVNRNKGAGPPRDRDWGVDDRLAAELNTLLQSVCYLFNSTSFREGRYLDFDEMEIDKKLGRKK